MEWDWIWKSILIVAVGTVLLRIAGRKSIAQMTLAQTVVMIAIGSLLIQPVAGKNIWVTFGVGAMLVLTLITMEFLQVKSDAFEKLITGKAVPLIENGELVENNLKKLRLTVDQLEIQLRQMNVAKINDVQWATLEPNGRMGYMLKEKAQYATKEDVRKIMEMINERLPYIRLATEQNWVSAAGQINSSDTENNNLFTEVVNKSHSNPPPTRLQ